jgi:hypothetical protein
MSFSCHIHSQKLLAEKISNAFNFLLGSISAIRVRKSKSDGEQGSVIELPTEFALNCSDLHFLRLKVF